MPKAKAKKTKTRMPKARKPAARKLAAKPAKAQPKATGKAAKPQARPRPKTKSTAASIVPSLRYRDAIAAIEFLCDAFGFEKHMVVPGKEGIIEHAQLTLGNGMIMLGSVRDNEFGRLMSHPDEIGNTVTQSPYVVVAEIDKHYDRARAAGAEIIMELAGQDYGGKLYSARDLEGHVWNFGSYDPWEETDEDA